VTHLFGATANFREESCETRIFFFDIKRANPKQKPKKISISKGTIKFNIIFQIVANRTKMLCADATCVPSKSRQLHNIFKSQDIIRIVSLF
jgi:hypothetical protein